MSSDLDLEWLQALEVVEQVVFSSTGKHLLEAEKIILRGAWDGKEYKEIASETTYSQKYLQHSLAPRLWKTITQLFGCEVQIGKDEVKSYLKKAVANYKRLTFIGQLPLASNFYGRNKELATLNQEIMQQRLIILTGDTGIGKSLLAVKMVSDLSRQPISSFDILAWKSIFHSLSVEELVHDLLSLLNLEFDSNANLYPKISYLINQLRKRRCLIVLDGFENILQNEYKQRAEHIRFFLRLAEELYQTCIILTSRVPFKELQSLSIRRPVLHIKIEGLDVESSLEIFKSKGLVDVESGRELIKNYGGNPALLEELAEEVKHYFGGSIKKFLQYKTTFIGERRQIMLHQLFGQPGLLSSLQREIMIYLANELLSIPGNSITITNLLDVFKERVDLTFSNQDLIAALGDLEKRSLIEAVEHNGDYEISYRLQAGVRKYIIDDPLGLVHQNDDRT